LVQKGEVFMAKKSKNEYEVLLNAKVIKVTNNCEIYFDNGWVLNYHPYETYLEKVNSNG